MSQEILDIMKKELEAKKGEFEAVAKNFSEETAKRAKEEIAKELAEKEAAINDKIKSIEAEFGRIKTDGAKSKSLIEEMKEGIAKNLDVKTSRLNPFEVKTVGDMTASNNLTGSVVASYAGQPALIPGRLVHFRDLVATVPSATGTYKFYREGAGEGSIAFQSSHGTTKSQRDFDFTEVTVTAEYLAGFARVAKQMTQDLPFMTSFLPQALLRDYLLQEDAEHYADLNNAATGSTTVTGTPTVDIEQIMGWVANIEGANYVPNGIVMNPKDVYKVLITKPSDYSLPGSVSISNVGGLTINGIPVYKSTFIAEDKVLVGDWTKCQIIQTDGLSIQSDDRGDNFTKNLVTYKVEARVGLAILNPDAFIYGDLGNV